MPESPCLKTSSTGRSAGTETSKCQASNKAKENREHDHRVRRRQRVPRCLAAGGDAAPVHAAAREPAGWGENDPAFLAINPDGFIPELVNGDVTTVESIAIMQYLTARYGPTPLALSPHDPAFPACLQFLHLSEAGLAALIYFVLGARNIAPEAERHNWSAAQALDVYQTRPRLVTRQLARSPYLAGDVFTAADISVTYALELAQRSGSAKLGEVEQAYVARATARDGYKRAMDARHDTRAWVAKAAGG